MFAQERKSLCLNEQHKNAIFLSLSFLDILMKKYDGGLNMKYDIIGDIHGCFQEFQNLTDKLDITGVAVYRFTLTNVNLHSLAILQTVVLIHYV